MTMGQTVWIARHGNRQDFVDLDWQRKSKFPYDPSLSHDGVIQARELAMRLKDEAIAHIFASPFLRTVETAHYVADALNLPVKLEAGFGEHLNSDWFTSNPERLSIEELVDRFPRIDQSYQSLCQPNFPETWEQTIERVDAIAHHLVDHNPENLLIVGHGATVFATATALLGDPSAQINCALCCLVKLVRKGDRWLMELNGDTSHLTNSEELIRWN